MGAKEAGEKLVLMEKMVRKVLMEFLGSMVKRGMTLLRLVIGMTHKMLTRSAPRQESKK